MTRLTADVTKHFRSGPTVRVAFDVPLDEFGVTILFGPSGSGKTTVLRCLAGLEKPEQGIIQRGSVLWFDAARGRCLPPQERDIGYLAQDHALFPHLSVRANIGYGLSRSQSLSRVAELIALLELTGLEERFPQQLSGGQRQRVALARAVARKPCLLLLDEPLSALDVPTREQLRRELRALLTAMAVPTLLVTHERSEALSLGDRLLVLDGGRVLQSGRVEEVFARPASLEVARIVGVETVAPGEIVAQSEDLVEVAVGSARLFAMADGVLPPRVYISVRGEDVILTRDEVTACSARNQLSGRVRTLNREGALTRVTLDCGFELTALVTRQSCADLGLVEGLAVRALLKASAVHLFPHG